MANKEHENILKKGVNFWNKWREENPEIKPDLSNIIFNYNANLSGINFSKSNLNRADFSYANLSYANLSRSNLFNAELYGAMLHNANLNNANLEFARLSEASLIKTSLINANLENADLTASHLVKVDLEEANLINCQIYGISAWNLNLKNTKQANLIITPYEESFITTVENLEIAQFIYMLLDNDKIRDIIDTTTSKVVLILGRFTDERLSLLHAIKEELRKYDYVPVIFDFNKPESRDFTETISLLAKMSRFIITDVTNIRSVSHELATIVPYLKIPIQPIIDVSIEKKPYGMMDDLKKYPWFLELYEYNGHNNLIISLKKLIDSLNLKAREFETEKK